MSDPSKELHITDMQRLKDINFTTAEQINTSQFQLKSVN